MGCIPDLSDATSFTKFFIIVDNSDVGVMVEFTLCSDGGIFSSWMYSGGIKL